MNTLELFGWRFQLSLLPTGGWELLGHHPCFGVLVFADGAPKHHLATFALKGI